jgi:site-specific DNA recombinase
LVSKIAAIYVRVSTKKVSQKDSPEHQKNYCMEEARKLGIDPRFLYEDRDTGTSIQARPEIQKMLLDAENKKFDTVIFASLSRFSRDAYDAIDLKRRFVNFHKIRLISVEDAYDSLILDDEFRFQIISSVNQKLSEQLSDSSKRGIRGSAIRGNFIGSIPPYGYVKQIINHKKTLVPHEFQSKVVQKIFDLYVNKQMGEKAITNLLNGGSGGIPIPSYKDGLWGVTSVQRILQNEVYTGRIVFGKYEMKKVYNDIHNMHDRTSKLFRRRSEEWERNDYQTHEALISDERFAKAQELRFLRGGGKRGGRKDFVNVFAKFIFCKHCGSAMVTMSSKKKDKKSVYRYLMCSRRRRQGEAGCMNHKWIPYYDVRDEIIRFMIQDVTKKINADTGTKEVMKHIKADNEIKALNRDIERRNKEIEKNRKYLFEINKRKFFDEMDEVQFLVEKEELEKQMKEQEFMITKLELEEKMVQDTDKLYVTIRDAVNELTHVPDYDDFDKTRFILSKLIHKIEVDHAGMIDVFTPLARQSEED